METTQTATDIKLICGDKKILSAFSKKNITNNIDLHRCFPIRYIDNRYESGINDQLVQHHVVVIGRLIKCALKTSDSGRRYCSCGMIDRITGRRLNFVIFSGAKYGLYLQWMGSDVIVSGILGNQYGYSIEKIDTLTDNSPIFNNKIVDYMRIIPVFSSYKGISTDKMKFIILSSISFPENETISAEIRKRYQIVDINTAIKYKMFPRSERDVFEADKRLLFDDLFYLSSRIVISKRKNVSTGIKITNTSFTDNIIKSLPYQLTEDQMKTYEQIKATLLAGDPLKMLVQGDVGCGKTITAFLAMFLIAENGHQSVIMAPTKILAAQHFADLEKLTANTMMKPILLCGKKISKKDNEKIKNGEYNLIVGTHSVISDKIDFADLKMIVIDEEHKFGVEQREKLVSKNDNPAVISMSATPIPRTLARAVYGDMVEVCNIHSMPGGRKPVITMYDNGSNIRRYLLPALQRKEQAYIVCPAIDSEKMDKDNILTTSKAIKKYKAMFPEYVVEEVNGAMSEETSNNIIEKFKNGEIDILISTTVIEVGVNVPNATFMVIQNAERFGLSGMHQLRGRVGRGNKQSYCLLISDKSPSENERIDTMCKTTDGFEIARLDMNFLRKSGDMFGTEQSGFNRYIPEMVLYPGSFKSIYETAQHTPSEILEMHINKQILMDSGKSIKSTIILKEGNNSL